MFLDGFLSQMLTMRGSYIKLTFLAAEILCLRFVNV